MMMSLLLMLEVVMVLPQLPASMSRIMRRLLSRTCSPSKVLHNQGIGAYGNSESMVEAIMDDRKPKTHAKGKDMAKARRPRSNTRSCSRKQKYASMLTSTSMLSGTRTGMSCHTMPVTRDIYMFSAGWRSLNRMRIV